MAEMVVAAALLALVVWLLRPLRRRISRAIAQRLRPSGNGRTVEGTFRVVPPDPKDKQ